MNEKDEAAIRIYEVGYHILPIISEENLPAEVGNIKGMIEGHGAMFISEEFPKLRPLAYALSKSVEGKRQDFDQAYFGWVKFEIDPEKALEIKKALDANKSVLRHIFIETVRESTMSFIRTAPYRKDEDRPEGEPEVKEELTAEDEEKVNQAIDDLVKE